MAIGFPVKADYVTGDVLSAANMNDLAGTLNYLDPTAKGDLFPASSGTALTRLAIGTDGQVLTADAASGGGMKWASSASGGQTLLSTTTLSSTSTTISGISGSYNDLQIVIYGINLNSVTQAYPNIKPNGVSTGVSLIRQVGTGGTVTNQALAAANIDLSYNNWLNANTNNAFVLTITNYASTTNYKTYQYSGQYTTAASAVESTNGAGNILSNTAISSLTFDTGGPTFSAGTVKIYGVK
jgi:hypothetical protein